MLQHLVSINAFCSIWSAYSNINYRKAYEGIGQSIVYEGWTGFIGYKSGYGSNTSWTGFMVNCGAAFSCNNISFLTSTATTNAEGSIYCDGTFACANTIITTNTFVMCRGLNSCSSSTITSTTHTKLYCHGHQSCSYTNITNMESIRARGAYALYRATIDTKDSTTDLVIYLHGEYSAYGATLICREGDKCTIDCEGYTACFMFYVQCLGTCTITAQNTIAPITETALFHTEDALIDSIATVNEHECNTQPTSITLDDSIYIRNVTNITNIEGPICCRAGNSCPFISIQSINTQFISCSGSQGCKGTNIDANNGNVFCEARSSCEKAIISNSDTLYCFASNSCKKSIIRKVPNILCLGYLSCENATIVSGGNDLYANFSGYDAGKGVNIYCDAGDVCNVMCNGHRACHLLTIFCNGICRIKCDYFCPQQITSHPTKSTIDPTSHPTEARSDRTNPSDATIDIATERNTAWDEIEEIGSNDTSVITQTILIIAAVVVVLIVMICCTGSAVLYRWRSYRQIKKSHKDSMKASATFNRKQQRIVSDSDDDILELQRAASQIVTAEGDGNDVDYEDMYGDDHGEGNEPETRTNAGNTVFH